MQVKNKFNKPFLIQKCICVCRYREIPSNVSLITLSTLSIMTKNRLCPRCWFHTNCHSWRFDWRYHTIEIEFKLLIVFLQVIAKGHFRSFFIISLAMACKNLFASFCPLKYYSIIKLHLLDIILHKQTVTLFLLII